MLKSEKMIGFFVEIFGGFEIMYYLCTRFKIRRASLIRPAPFESSRTGT